MTAGHSGGSDGGRRRGEKRMETGKTPRREENGDGESAVATPNGSSRKKKIVIRKYSSL